ncbi:MAG: hypothetical protein IJQ02_06995 [Oscillospiraceae bacterium]|nr:hypothetical protein [Oscillospiraceae bacterium]
MPLNTYLTFLLLTAMLLSACGSRATQPETCAYPASLNAKGADQAEQETEETAEVAADQGENEPGKTPEEAQEDSLGEEEESVHEPDPFDEVLRAAREMRFEEATEMLEQMEPSAKRDALLAFCAGWDISEPTDVLEGAIIHSELPGGTFYRLTDCFIYLPDHVDSETKYLVHFGGGTGGWVLRQDFPELWLQNEEPNVIAIFYKSAMFYTIKGIGEETLTILKSLSTMTGIAPPVLVITGSSNGSYSTFKLAAQLYEQASILTDKILTLDTGYDWDNTDMLATEEEAASIVEMDTVVYAFEKKTGAINARGAQKLRDYGIKMVNVACVHASHDQITKYAFRRAAFSWALGQAELDLEEYTPTKINFD